MALQKASRLYDHKGLTNILPDIGPRAEHICSSPSSPPSPARSSSSPPSSTDLLTPRAGTQLVRKIVLQDAAPVTTAFTCSWHCCDIRYSWMAAAQLALFISWRLSRYGRMDNNPDLPLVGKKKQEHRSVNQSFTEISTANSPSCGTYSVSFCRTLCLSIIFLHPRMRRKLAFVPFAFRLIGEPLLGIPITVSRSKGRKGKVQGPILKRSSPSKRVIRSTIREIG
ncbi:hypothetical protein Taro_006536 [Colocasia esculenta]|uniref:Uncharacterized protein n=1 Tax=Colocasia esculenta TaxID=4460 RepID=A0A843TRE1_COLES|nr:hypothetical protein [Colocasia esculenta]